jgi:hypothetical protein
LPSAFGRSTSAVRLALFEARLRPWRETLASIGGEMAESRTRASVPDLMNAASCSGTLARSTDRSQTVTVAPSLVVPPAGM